MNNQANCAVLYNMCTEVVFPHYKWYIVHSLLSYRRTKVVLEHEIMLDGATVSAAFDKTLDMGIIGTTAGTIWYINWSDYGSIRLVSGHENRVLCAQLPYSLYVQKLCWFETCFRKAADQLYWPVYVNKMQNSKSFYRHLYSIDAHWNTSWTVYIQAKEELIALYSS